METWLIKRIITGFTDVSAQSRLATAVEQCIVAYCLNLWIFFLFVCVPGLIDADKANDEPPRSCLASLCRRQGVGGVKGLRGVPSDQTTHAAWR